MKLRELKALINKVPEKYDDLECFCPIKTDIPNMFAFDGICPGVTGVIELGPAPEYIKDLEAPCPYKEGDRIFLVAPHAYHDGGDEDQDEVKQKTLN